MLPMSITIFCVRRVVHGLTPSFHPLHLLTTADISLTPPSDGISSLAWSSDSKQLLVSSWDGVSSLLSIFLCHRLRQRIRDVDHSSRSLLIPSSRPSNSTTPLPSPSPLPLPLLLLASSQQKLALRFSPQRSLRSTTILLIHLG